MKTLYKIGHAAKIIGVSVDTLRRWEEDRILVPVFKTPKGTRFYSYEQAFTTKPLRGIKYKKRQVKEKRSWWRIWG